MKRPNVQAMEEIEAVLQDVEELEDAIRSLKQRLKDLPAEMALQLASEEERLEGAKYLYWLLTDLSGTAIAEGLLGTNIHDLKRRIGTATGTIECERCGEQIKFTSRAHMQRVIQAQEKEQSRHLQAHRVICEDCSKAINLARHEEYWQHRMAQQRRLNELKTMPYYEYLRTNEWQARRQQHLRSAGYRCQVCNAKGAILDVHHRTYERRGEENFKDLIALCRSCHELFHREGRLAVE